MSNFIHIYIFVVIVDFTPCFPINITVNKIQSSSVYCRYVMLTLFAACAT
jgi:hypothetical protein